MALPVTKNLPRLVNNTKAFFSGYQILSSCKTVKRTSSSFFYLKDCPVCLKNRGPANQIPYYCQLTTAAENMSANQVEAVVCDVDDLKNGEMKEVDVGGVGKALLVRDGSNFYAVGAKCTHYGAPLEKGVYCNGRVRCPWHGACFNIKTGDIEDYPGLDSIHAFKVEVKDGKVKVIADKSALENKKRQKGMCKKAADKRKVLIIGGGPASVACAETLRQEGFQGDVTIVTKDKYIPYDRIKLSKAMDIKPDAIALRPAEFYKSHDITVNTDKEVKSVDTKGKTVTFVDGSTTSYDTLMVATGGKPRVLPIPGVELENVFTLRTPDDANKIAENIPGKNVVIIGSSFIGMEVASFLAEKAKSVSVVDIIKVPFELVLGPKVGNILQKMHEEKGIKFHFQSGIKEFVGKDGKVTEAVLSTGTKIPADICILGVGVAPATEFLKGSGISLTDRGFIPVNEVNTVLLRLEDGVFSFQNDPKNLDPFNKMDPDQYMATDQPDVFACGDIVEFPLFTVGLKNANVQHWQMAHAHGRNAALNILGKKQAIKSVPYFWTVQYGKSIRYTGFGPGYDDVVVHGNLDEYKFVAFYTKGEDVVAVASLNFDPIVSQAAEMMQNGKKITKKDILTDPKSWINRL